LYLLSAKFNAKVFKMSHKKAADDDVHENAVVLN